MKKYLFRIIILCLVSMLLAVAAASAEYVKPLSYDDPYNWSYWAENQDKQADLFIICPTVDMGRDGSQNMDCTNEKLRTSFTGALNMQLGIYSDVCTIYAPFYQQASFPMYDLGEAGKKYFDFAYQDVRLAFLYYLEHCDAQRPLVLAGFSQGSEMAIRIMKEFFADEALSDRLVAAYAIGWRLTDEDLAAYPQLRMAQGENDTGVIITFNSESEAVTGSLMVPEGVKTYSINPLSWYTDSTPADASMNLGACFTDYSGNIKNEIPAFCGAYLDEVRGTLKVPGIDDAAYPGKIFPDGIYHLYDYQFFFRNLQQNVAVRLNAWMNK